MEPVDKSNAASSSHQTTSDNSSKRRRLLADLCSDASTSSPRVPAFTEPPVDGHNLINELRSQKQPMIPTLSSSQHRPAAVCDRLGCAPPELSLSPNRTRNESSSDLQSEDINRFVETGPQAMSDQEVAIESLNEGNFITDTVIKFAFDQMRAQRRDGVEFIDPSVSRAIYQSGGDIIASQVETLQMRNLIIVPVNNAENPEEQGTHWTLIALRPIRDQAGNVIGSNVRGYDTLGSDSGMERENRIAREILQNLGWPVSVPDRIVEPQIAPGQTYNNCGIDVIRIGSYLASFAQHDIGSVDNAMLSSASIAEPDEFRAIIREQMIHSITAAAAAALDRTDRTDRTALDPDVSRRPRDLTKKHEASGLTQEQEQCVEQMYHDGKPYTTIADKMGIAQVQIRKALKRLNLKKRDQSAPSTQEQEQRVRQMSCDAASSSHQPTSDNSGTPRRLLSDLSPGASTASPSISAAIQPPGNNQGRIRQRRAQGPPAERQLSNREQMAQALNTWVQNGRMSENRSEAARRVLEAFDTNNSQLDLSGLGLRSLPREVGNLTRLTNLRLNNNRLTRLPRSIYLLPGATQINLEQNPLSQRASVGFSQQAAELRINSSIFGAFPGERLQEGLDETVVRHYCSQIAPDHLANLQNSENADAFGRLLDRLRSTAEARHPGFQQRVAAAIETLAEAGSAELRARCYLMAYDGLESCSDRVAITFGNIEVDCKVHRISQTGGGHEQMADLLRGLFRMNALDDFVRTDISGRQGDPDEIEVFLAYRVGLKDELHLPCETAAMLHHAISGVDQQRLDSARAHVLAAESADNGANLVEFATEQPFWKEYIESNTSYQEAGQRIDEDSQARLADLDDRRETISDDDLFSQTAQIVAQRNQQFNELLRDYTRRML